MRPLLALVAFVLLYCCCRWPAGLGSGKLCLREQGDHGGQAICVKYDHMEGSSQCVACGVAASGPA